MEELWKDIDGDEFNGYQVSNLGRIKSYRVYKYGRILKLQLSKDGYYKIGIRGYNNKYYNKSVHRLVAIAFVDNPDPNNFEMINHIDCIRTNNISSNLEWCNVKYNNKYRFKHGDDFFKGSNHHKSKITEDIAKNIYIDIHSGKYSCVDVAKKYQTTKDIVSNIKRENTWKHVTKKINIIKNKKTYNIQIKTNMGELFNSINEASRILGTSGSNIRKALNDKSRSSVGRKWDYV